MELSVVVSTLNDRERLLSCLDAIGEHLPASTELIVVNGPSSDGTTGTVRERDDVDVLVEISDRHRSASRNAGLEHASGDVVAFLGDEYAVTDTWYDAVEAAFRTDADVVTGPIRGVGSRSAGAASDRIDGQAVTPFDGDNVAFDRAVVDALDGFDEYLPVDSGRDCAHRVSALGFDVTRSAGMAVRTDVGADGGRAAPDWGDRYRSRTYYLVKNYGLRPHVVGRTLVSAVRDGFGTARDVLSGEDTATGWLHNGSDVAANLFKGLKDGVAARRADDGSRRNPNGVSARHDRAVQVYDRR